MRILILTTYYPPDSSANGALMREISEDLASFGHQVSVLTTFPHYDDNSTRKEYRGKLWAKEPGDGLKITRAYSFVPKRKTSKAGRVLNYVTWNMSSGLAGILVGSVDMIFVPSPPLTSGIMASLIGRFHRVPYIYNVQDIYPDIAVRLGILKGRRSVTFFKRMEKTVYAKAAAISVISEGFRQNLLSKGVPPDKIQVIPNFADTDFIRPLPRYNDFSKGLELNDRFVVLFAGNVGLSQGLERVLEAALVLRGYRDIAFLLVGNGAAKRDLVGQAKRLKLDNVIFRPFFPYQQIPSMYASADICLVPLRVGITKESVPSKVYSIMAAARPFVASVDEGSDTWQLINRADCGLCIPPEDPKALAEAVLRLYHDPETRARMGENGRAYVEKHFARRQVSKMYEQLFLDVISRRQ